jgi:uncharacterized iron-regulated membrane protein
VTIPTWRRWTERPQSLWVRKLLFQIHLWTGITVCLYVAVISLSGSAIVLRRELEQPAKKNLTVASAGRTPLTTEQIQQRAQLDYPLDEVLNVVDPQNPERPYAVVLEIGKNRVERMFDPYTGEDLGDPQSPLDRVFDWFTDLHDNLLSGLTGRTLNGIGSSLLVLLAITGTVIWWPGIQNWRRSTRIQWSARFARLNWDLHSAIGFWCYLFVLIWGISGICLCFPGTLDYFLNNHVRSWITRLHFGRFNAVTEVAWTIVGLAPAVLATTGALMWWNRVLSKKVAHFRNQTG